ncbi:hypothetical protein BC830DRAFT_1101813 [Chytriomyces sp. MP71]|nr:hypothetical protein BC830DRAFT_1101813 [Chytriomyces sp. MP71]
MPESHSVASTLKPAPEAYNPAFNKNDRAEFSYKLLQLIRLSGKFRNALSQLAAAAHDLGGGFKDLKRGKVGGSLSGLDKLEAIAGAYTGLAQALSALGPNVIQNFDGPIQGIANSYVASFASMERESTARLNVLSKNQKRIEKDLSSPWPWKRAGVYAEQQLTRELAEVFAEKEHFKQTYTARVFLHDAKTVDAIGSIALQSLMHVSEALAGWADSGRDSRVTNADSDFRMPKADITLIEDDNLGRRSTSEPISTNMKLPELTRAATMPRMPPRVCEPKETVSTSETAQVDAVPPSPKSFQSSSSPPQPTTETTLHSELVSIKLQEREMNLILETSKVVDASGTITPRSMDDKQAVQPSATDVTSQELLQSAPQVLKGNVFAEPHQDLNFVEHLEQTGLASSASPANGASIMTTTPKWTAPPSPVTESASLAAVKQPETTAKDKPMTPEQLRLLVSPVIPSRMNISATMSLNRNPRGGLKSALRNHSDAGFESLPRNNIAPHRGLAVLEEMSAPVWQETVTLPILTTRVRRKSVHFTDPSRPMVEFWDCHDSKVGAAEDVMSISSGSGISGEDGGDAVETSARTDLLEGILDAAATSVNGAVTPFPSALRKGQQHQTRMDVDTMRSLYPDMFVTESNKVSGKPVQYVEDTFYVDNEAQKRVGPPVFFLPQADVESEVGSVIASVEASILQTLAGRSLFIAIFRHVPKEAKEMALEKGDIVDIVKRSGKWVFGTKVGCDALKNGSTSLSRPASGATKKESGWIPAAFIMRFSPHLDS